MTKKKQTILFYCQHSLGMGHLVRSLALAKSLAKDFDVVLLNGGRFPNKLSVGEKIKIINLPPLGLDRNWNLISCDKRRTVERAKFLRKNMILSVFRRLKPEIILIELFPFGRKKFADELLPLLEEGKKTSKIICSLRDILVGSRSKQERFETRAIKTANKYFDAIFIHSDKSFAKLEESLITKERLQIPQFYTGFVVPDSKPISSKQKHGKTKKIIVSAGGGRVGETLIRSSIGAHKILSKLENIKTKIAVGLFLPEDAYRNIKRESKRIKGLTIRRFIPGLRAEMAVSDVSVSQCGYNTAFDILLSSVSAIVVPYSENGEDEQKIRADKLEKMKALKVLDAKDSNPERLAREIATAFSFKPQRVTLGISGGDNSVKAIKRLLQRSEIDAISKNSWLKPIRQALIKKNGKATIFFRDDDAGIADKRLFSMLEIFERFTMPLDIAVIPKEISRKTADKLIEKIIASEDRFSVHQHGFSHLNHESEGRKFEFGVSRSVPEQFRDISSGKKILSELFGDLPKPIFTPPWNRCSIQTPEVLGRLDFKILSRESKAKPMDLKGLVEMPISVDWFAKRKGIYLEREEIGRIIADRIQDEKPFGIMLHHAEMDVIERDLLVQLFKLFLEFSQMKFVSMWKHFLNNQNAARSAIGSFS